MPTTVIPLPQPPPQLADRNAGRNGVFQQFSISSLEPPTIFKLRIDHLLDANASTYIPEKSGSPEFSITNINPYDQVFDPPQNISFETRFLRDQENNDTKLSAANLPASIRSRVEKILKIYDADIVELNTEKIFAIGTQKTQTYSGNGGAIRAITEQSALLKIFIKPFKDYVKEGAIAKYLGNKLASSSNSFPKLLEDPHNLEGIAYLVFEYADGRNFSGLLKGVSSNGKITHELTKEDILNYGIKLAKAFELQHSLGILHLDIKPANCMLSSEGQIFIVDQGGAQIIDIDLAEYLRLPKLKGPFSITPNYAAPEQFYPELFNQIDRRTDIYGLGYTLYALLTGREPFLNKSLLEIIEAKKELIPEDSNIDPPLYKLLVRMTHPEMFMRPTSMRQVHEAISALVKPQTPKAEDRSSRLFKLINKLWSW